ncbi:MAG: hypothetical protein AAFY59_14840 [Pseudomonadota bacterium]
MPRDVNPEPSRTRWEDYFEPGEKLVWQGRPIPGGGHPGYILLSLFGMPFLGAGLFTFKEGVDHLIGAAVDLEADFDFMFLIPFSLPFLAIGAGLVFGPWLWPRYALRRTRYALSNKRAYIATTIWGQKLETYAITADADIEIESRRHHTVTFANRVSKDSDGDLTTTKISFENIEEGEKVYHLLRDIQRSA